MLTQPLKKVPKISIITPSYNQGRFLEEAILSVLNQGYFNFEHIILDNCSSDNTIEILKKYKHLIWISEPDQGQSDALNRGFRLAKGEIIGWLNSDERYLPGCFEQIYLFFKNKPDTEVVYGNCRWINESGQVFQMRKELNFDLFLLKYHHVLSISTVATFFRRRIFDHGNLLDSKYHFAMDYEFLLRLALNKYRFSHINKFLGDFRWHDNCKSDLSTEEQILEREKALIEHDHLMQSINNLMLRKLVRKIFLNFARIKRYSLKALKGYYFSQWKSPL